MTLSIDIVRVWPTAHNVMLQWTYRPDPGVYGTFTFDVDRSEGPEGPWTRVGTVTNSLLFTNELIGDSQSANLLSIVRSLFYRVTVTAPNNKKVVSVPVSIDGQRANDPKQEAQIADGVLRRRFMLRRKAIRDAALAFKLNGVEIGVLKRRHFGARCTSCYDPLTKLVTKSRCPVCFGTSWTGGYYNAINTFGKISPSGTRDVFSGEGQTEINTTRIIIPFYPLVERDDVLVELDSNMRWIVKEINSTELRRLTVHQSLGIIELPRTAVEYAVPLTENP